MSFLMHPSVRSASCSFIVSMFLIVACLGPRKATAQLTYSIMGAWDTPARRNAADAAMAAVIARFNAYGNFTLGNDGNVEVIYNPGVPTADANYNAVIRFGGTFPAQRVAQHELNHWLGSGTHSSWYDQFNAGGVWTGSKVNALIRQFEGDNAEFRQSGVHFFPFGLNFDTEVVSNNSLPQNVALMYAMRQDMGIGVQADPWSANVVRMTRSDPLGTSGFNWFDSWDDGYFAHAGAAYFTDNFLLRTPTRTSVADPTGEDTPSFTFAGDSLTINNTNGINGGLLYKGVGTTGRITVNNLILDGGYVRHANGAGDLFQLAGNLTVTNASTINAAQGNIHILSKMSGNGSLNIPTSSFFVRSLGWQNKFTGNLNVSGRYELRANANQVFSIGTSGVNNRIQGSAAAVLLNGALDIDLSNASSQLGNSWSLVTASNVTYGNSFEVRGFTNSAGRWTNKQGYQFASGVLSIPNPTPVAIWNGSTSNQIGSTENWTGSPTTGSELRFGAASGSGTVLVNSSMTFNSHRFRGIKFESNAAAYTLSSGNPLTNGFTLEGSLINDSQQTQTLNGNVSLTFARTAFQTNSMGNVIVNGNLVGAGGITKTGLGTLTIAGQNTFSGGVRVEGGTLAVTGTVNSANQLSLGGGKLEHRGSNPSLSFNGTQVIRGFSEVSSPNPGFEVNLGALTRNIGGAVVMNGTIRTSTANTNGIIGPWAFVGSGSNVMFATNNNTVVEGFTGATASTTFGYASDENANYEVSGIGGPFGVSRTVNTVRYVGAGGSVLSNSRQTFGFNGILQAGTGELAFGSSSTPELNVSAGNSGELVLAAMRGNIRLNDAVIDGTSETHVTVVGPNRVILEGANRYSGITTVGHGSTLQLGTGGGGVGLMSPLVQNHGLIDFNHSNSLSLSSTLTGSGGMIKRGSGTLTLTGVNSMSGNVTLTAGSLELAGDGSIGASGFNDGLLSMATGTTLLVTTDKIQRFSGGITGNGRLRNSGNVILSNDNSFSEIETLVAGQTTISGGTTISGLTRIALSAGSTGTLNLDGGVLQTAQLSTGSGNARIHFNGGVLRATGNNASFYSPTATTTTLVRNGGLQVDTNGFDLVMNASLTHSSIAGDNAIDGGLDKRGLGKLTLSGTNTYTGATTVRAGLLVINGDNSGATGNLTVQSGATLAGAGIIGGDTTILAGGFLNPGNSPGKLDFSGTLTLQGTTNIEISDNNVGEFDVLNGDGTNVLTFGGVLALDNTGYFGNATLGDTITIFSRWNSFSGSFASITGTDLGGGLRWDISQLATNGSLRVTAIPEPTSFGLFICCVAGLEGLRRRRRQYLINC